MKIVIAIFAIFALAFASAAPLSEEESQFLFTSFMKQFNKIYQHDELVYRYGVFKENLEFIRTENEKGHSYTLGMNEFGDLKLDEFKAKYFGYNPRQNSFIRSQNAPELGAVQLPSSVDWTTKGAVTPVKNQEQCGSCWAFSTTGSVEGAWFLAGNTLVSLSEQQLVDCSSAEGNMGCNGGLMDDAFEYIIKNGGICSEASYPYHASDGSCHSCQSVAHISSYKDVPSNDQDALMQAVAMNPVSIAIEADQSAFQFYSGGVFDAACGTQLDHGVLIVGYGTDGKDFWKVKNSWGASWGENGYIRMIRTSGSGPGECGLAMQPSYPIV